jgi:hypothetical protein
MQDRLNTIEQIGPNLTHNQQWVEVMVLWFASAIMNHNKIFHRSIQPCIQISLLGYHIMNLPKNVYDAQ